MRQKNFFIRLDRLADAVIWRGPFLALWKAGNERVQLIFDFFPIPIGHRCLCARQNCPDGRLTRFAGSIPNH